MISAVKLQEFDCSKCPAHRRKILGCHGGGSLIRLGRVETRKCPKRWLLERPYLSALFEIYDPEAAPDLELASPAAEALTVIRSAQAWQRSQDE